MFSIKRREFILLMGGAAAAWPLSARAQPERMRRIGVLMTLKESDPEARAWVATLKEGLQKLGWEQDLNVRIDYRWSAGDPDRIRTFAAELVALAPDVILCSGADHHGVATSYAHSADRVCAGRRSCRQRSRSDSGASGREHHRLHPF
jgi:ABC-type uncharacterized transport system substrate-binding protein